MNAETMVPDSTYVDVAEVPWQPTRFPGVEWKILMENKATGMSTALDGRRLPDACLLREAQHLFRLNTVRAE